MCSVGPEYKQEVVTNVIGYGRKPVSFYLKSKFLFEIVLIFQIFFYVWLVFELPM